LRLRLRLRLRGIQMVSDSSRWFQMVSDGFRWFQMVFPKGFGTDGFRWFQKTGKTDHINPADFGPSGNLKLTNTIVRDVS
jgi:hypothetical protein